jgi:hypothetical protein
LYDVQAYSLKTRLLKVTVACPKKVAAVVVAQMLHDVRICTLDCLISIIVDSLLCAEKG